PPTSASRLQPSRVTVVCRHSPTPPVSLSLSRSAFLPHRLRRFLLASPRACVWFCRCLQSSSGSIFPFLRCLDLVLSSVVQGAGCHWFCRWVLASWVPLVLPLGTAYD
ncbi:hypothetical protein S83_047501, partial [Arachis hypogaea]